MNEKSRIVIDLLREDDRVSWVRDHLVASFAEGIAQSAKERGLLDQAYFEESEPGLAQRERTKREKYETSRPYNEDEKIELLKHAIHEVYLAVPAMRVESARRLRELGAGAESIEFTPPEDEEQSDRSYTQSVDVEPSNYEDLKRRYSEFVARLDS